MVGTGKCCPGKSGADGTHCLSSSWWPWVLQKVASIMVRFQPLSRMYLAFFYLLSILIN